jgi:hypothetical protein
MNLSQAVENLILYDPEFESQASQWLTAVGPGAIYPLIKIADITEASNRFTLVKSLVFLIHGTPGTLYLAGGGVITGGFNLLVTSSRFLKREARILFLSCSIGAGDRGDKFMEDVGKSLLRGKGGFVGASTVTNYVGPFGLAVMGQLGSDGRLKVKQYDASGKEVGARTVDRYGNKTN